MDEEWDIVDVNGAVEGSSDAWELLDTYLRTSAHSPEEAFDVIDGIVEIENFIDYVILQTYIANIDWTPNNWIAAKPRTPDSRFIFLPWDLEQGFQTNYRDLNLFVEDELGPLGLNDQDDTIALL